MKVASGGDDDDDDDVGILREKKDSISADSSSIPPKLLR
jgi:hypothetical protein